MNLMDDKVVDMMIAHEEVKNNKREVEVLVEGSWGWLHRHNFKRVDWDKEEHGSDFVNVREFTATFKDRYRCRCGREVIVSRRALF